MIAIFFKIIVMHLSPSIWLKVNIQNSPEYFTKSFQKQTMKEKLHLTLILQLKNLFKERNIPYPLIYNSYDLLLLLDKLHITNNCTTCVSQLLTSHPFTPTYHTMTLLKPSAWAENCLICQTFIGTIYLTSIKTKLFYCWWYLLQAIRGSLWIVTIADKLWDLCSHY